MKQIKFVITSDYNSFQYHISTRDYLTVWSGNATLDDPLGVFWTSFDNFKYIQNRIKSPKDGIITLFDTEEEANRVADELGVTGYTVRKILWEV